MTVRSAQLRRIVAAFLLLVTLIAVGTAGSRPASARADSVHQTLSASTLAADRCSTLNCYRQAMGETFFDNQEDLLQFNAAIAASPDSAAGYAGSYDDAANAEVTVYWHGSVPASLELDALAQRYGLGLTVKRWPLSFQQIELADKAIATTLDSGAVPGFKPSIVGGFDPTFAGITVSGVYDQNNEASIQAAVQAAASTITAAPIRVVYAEYGDTAGRYDDTSPFNAGDFMSSATDLSCSNGFAFLFGTINKTITARHCQATDYVPPDNEDAYGGTVAYGAVGQSRVLVGDGIARVWDGSALSSTQYEYVKDSVAVQTGDELCSDGANGGLHCALQVTVVGGSADDGYGREPEDFATRQTNYAADIQGDSGGPVIIPLPNSDEVHAVGIDQTYVKPNLEPNCGFTPYEGGTLGICTRVFGFTSISDIILGLRPTGKTVELATH